MTMAPLRMLDPDLTVGELLVIERELAEELERARREESRLRRKLEDLEVTVEELAADLAAVRAQIADADRAT